MKEGAKWLLTFLELTQDLAKLSIAKGLKWFLSGSST
jgi:hypothetical protein